MRTNKIDERLLRCCVNTVILITEIPAGFRGCRGRLRYKCLAARYKVL